MLKTQERSDSRESGNDSNMFGNAIETIVLSRKAMNTPSPAIRRTVRGETARRVFGKAVSDMDERSRCAHDGDRQEAGERDCRRDVEGDQPGERSEARRQQPTDVHAAEEGLVA